MNTALIGHTGFVGKNLLETCKFNDFYNSGHKLIYSAIAFLSGESKPFDPLTLEVRIYHPTEMTTTRSWFDSLYLHTLETYKHNGYPSTLEIIKRLRRFYFLIQ